MSYRIRLSPAATARLKETDRLIAQRIYKRIQWLGKNFEQIHPEALKGRFAGTYKFRIGSYRIVYSIHHEEKLLYINAFGNRKNAYKEH